MIACSSQVSAHWNCRRAEAFFCEDVLEFLLPISGSYPGFEHWFHSKVAPGILTGTRYILRIERFGRLAAVGIAKNEDGERKLCTIRVAPEYEGRGLGIRVLDYLLAWVGTDLPVATVSEEKMPSFARILERYGFMITSTEAGLYRPGRIEYIYNQPDSPLLATGSRPQ